MNFLENTSVATHNGIFHADEVTAVALLRLDDRFGNVTVTRTRNAELINSADVAVDVGFVYDVEAGRFDHHQPDYKGPLSSAGMIYAALNRYGGYCDYMSEPCTDLWCTCDPGMAAVKPDVSWEQTLIKEIDAQDTGVARNGDNHYCQIISSFNTTDIYSEAQDAAFDEAVSFAMGYWSRKRDKAVHDAKMAYKASKVEVITIKETTVAVVPKGDEFIPNQLIQAEIVVQWDDNQKNWMVNSKSNLLLPTGRSSEEFCHKAGFAGRYKVETYLPYADPLFCSGLILNVGKDLIVKIGEVYCA